uniref:Homeobox protein cut n=1 Tax=Aceria tosichella TaxID=561515 RepID=A0A6G1S7J5_9ACAR
MPSAQLLSNANMSSQLARDAYQANGLIRSHQQATIASSQTSLQKLPASSPQFLYQFTNNNHQHNQQQQQQQQSIMQFPPPPQLPQGAQQNLINKPDHLAQYNQMILPNQAQQQQQQQQSSNQIMDHNGTQSGAGSGEPDMATLKSMREALLSVADILDLSPNNPQSPSLGGGNQQASSFLSSLALAAAANNQDPTTGALVQAAKTGAGNKFPASLAHLTQQHSYLRQQQQHHNQRTQRNNNKDYSDIINEPGSPMSGSSSIRGGADDDQDNDGQMESRRLGLGDTTGSIHGNARKRARHQDLIDDDEADDNCSVSSNRTDGGDPMGEAQVQQQQQQQHQESGGYNAMMSPTSSVSSHSSASSFTRTSSSPGGHLLMSQQQIHQQHHQQQLNSEHNNQGTTTNTATSTPTNSPLYAQNSAVYELAALTPDLDTPLITTRIKETLMAHNLGQKIFGEVVLGLSQGSVSELLSKPKPWHMLSIKGREPFIRMHLWLNDKSNIDRLQSLKNERREAKRIKR